MHTGVPNGSKQFLRRVRLPGYGMAIGIFSMHDLDLVFFLKIGWGVWICRIGAVYSAAGLCIYGAGGIGGMLGGGGG